MLTLLARILRLKVLLAGLAVFFAWQVFMFLRPRPRVFAPDEVNALHAAAQIAVERLAPEIGPTARIGVARLGNDPLDTATTVLKTALAARPGWRVEEHSIIQRFLADVSRAVAQATSLDEIVRAGQKVDLDVIIAGKVSEVATEEGITRASLELTAYDARKGAVALRDTFTADWRPTILTRLGRAFEGVGPFWRFILWLGVVLALPWVTRFATVAATGRKSNLASFLLVLAYTIAGLLLAALMTGFQLLGGGQWLRFFGALIICAGYSFWACERIAAAERA